MAALTMASQAVSQAVGLGHSQLHASQRSLGCQTTSFAGQRVQNIARVANSARSARVQASLDSDKVSPSKVAQGLAAFALSAALQFSPVLTDKAFATDFDVLRSTPPFESHIYDDAGVLNRVSRSSLKKELTEFEKETGYHIDVVTTRKLQARPDIFEYADAILEHWYPTLEEGDKKGVLVLVTSQKEGAVAGGPSFNKAVGETILESVSTETLPILAVDEKYNEGVTTAVKRLANAIKGLEDPGAPKVVEQKRESNYLTKEQTESKKPVFVTVVGGLLVIAFVVPMVQYYSYVGRK